MYSRYRLLKIKLIANTLNRDRESSSSGHRPIVLDKLRLGSKHSLNEDSEKPASNFLSSVLSAAQNVTSALRSGISGPDHKRTGSDGAFLSFINEAAHPFNDPLVDLTMSREGNNLNEETPEGVVKVSDVKIEPIRSAISTLGKGELSLESLGLTPDENPISDSSLPHNNSNFSTMARNESLRIPESAPSVSIRESPDMHHRSSLDAGTTPKRSRRSRGSLIGRMSEKGKGVPARSNSVNSFRRSRQSRHSFSDIPFPNIVAGGSSHAVDSTQPTTTGPAISVSAEPESSLQLPSGTNVAATNDSDDSDRPKPRGDHENGKHLAGIAYANKKRNQDFHKLFRSLPPNDFLLDDFSCALNREILIQGRMYVSERNICFNSNILGWVTNLIISFDEIVGLEKKTTAGLFPNGIVVQTLHARSSFASFISRDTVFTFLMSIWRQTNTRPDLHNGGGSELGFEGTEEDTDGLSGTDTDSNSMGDEEYDETEEDMSNFGSSDDEVSTDEEFGESARDPKPKEKANAVAPAAVVGAAVDHLVSLNAEEGAGGAAQWPVANLGPETHAPTNPNYDYEGAGEKLLINDTVAAPLGVVANLLFGKDVKWISTFIVEKEKNIDLKNMAGFESGLADGNKRVYEYIKPLGGPVGPKQTRCLCTDTIEHWDPEGHLTIVTSTQTPDVPSGGVFTTKTRYTIWWGENNATQVMLSYLIEWTGKSWFKGPIEKGTHDGQMSFSKNLINELNLTVKKSSKGKGGTRVASKGATAGGSGKKGSKKSSSAKKRRKSASINSDAKKQEPVTAVRRIMDVLMMEPISMVPIPMWALVIVGFVMILTFQALMGNGNDDFGNGGVGGSSSSSLSSSRGQFGRGSSGARGGALSKEKLEMLRMEEEYNIWRWIDDRSSSSSSGMKDNKNNDRKKKRFNRALYHDQNLQEAIRLTELRVRELKNALDT